MNCQISTHYKSACKTSNFVVYCVKDYGPLNRKNVGEQFVHSCVTCIKAKSKFQYPFMGQLPSMRTYAKTIHQHSLTQKLIFSAHKIINE